MFRGSQARDWKCRARQSICGGGGKDAPVLLLHGYPETT